MLAYAAEQFGGKDVSDILQVCLSTMEGHQRAIMGVSVVSYTLKDVQDEVGYLASLGQARTAQVKRDAIIGEAEAKKDSTIAEAYADEQRMEAKLANDAG